MSLPSFCVTDTRRDMSSISSYLLIEGTIPIDVGQMTELLEL